MKRICAIVIWLVVLKPSIAQNIAIAINNPTSFQISDSVLSIKVSIQSTYSITSATAVVNGRVTPLTYTQLSPGFYYYVGMLSLSGLNQDTLTLRVFAKDVQSNRDSATVKFIYDKLPVLAIIEPLNNSVASPLIRVKARCIDKDSCIINIRGIAGYADTIYAGSFIDSVDVTIDLSRGEGSLVVLGFSVTDKRGQTNNMYGGEVFVESSPYLTKVFEGNDLIIDFNYNKPLISENGIIGNRPPSNPNRIINIITKDSVIIPNNVALTQEHAYLTPFGAIFISPDMTSSVDSIIDWNSGTLNFLGTVYGTFALLAKGNYAIWTGNLTTGGITTQEGLVYRDCASKTTTLVSTLQGIDNSGGNAVLADGTIAYSAVAIPSGNVNVLTYKNGNTQMVTNNTTIGNIVDYDISTDGINILYNQHDIWLGSNYLRLSDGQKDTLLANLGKAPFLSSDIHKIYQADNNFLVFPKEDSFGISQLWLKDSLGNYSKITSFGSYNGADPRVQLDLLNAKGDIIFYATNWQGNYNTKQRRYFESKGQIKEICSGFPNNGSPELCRTFYRDSSWYISIGRDLFRINLNIAPNTVTSSTINVKEDSVYGLSNAQFIKNFTGPGQLIYSMVKSLPANGTLELNGAPVAVNSVIVRADLDQLSYVPNKGFTGIDSFAWNGSNGINYTSSAGLIRIQVTSLASPQRPILSGMGNNYCNNEGNQKIKINNPPVTGGETNVQVKIDSTSLSIGGDSTFSFNVNSLSTTTHTVSVVFSNPLGAASTIDSFNVISAVTPIVTLNVSENTVTSNSLPITLTAKSVSGGGYSPEFIFASDRGFSHVFQQSSKSNTLTIQPSALNIGSNWLYVQMKTSESCYTSETGIDSIQLLRKAFASLFDPDYPNQGISIFPNPFDHQITIYGLQTSKMYSIIMTDAEGRQIFFQSAANTQLWQMAHLNVGRGVYTLRLFDRTKNRIVGVIKLVAK